LDEPDELELDELDELELSEELSLELSELSDEISELSDVAELSDELSLELSEELSEVFDEISELSLELIRLEDDFIELLEFDPESETEQAPNSPRAKSNIITKAKSLSLIFCIFLSPFFTFLVLTITSLLCILYIWLMGVCQYTKILFKYIKLLFYEIQRETRS